MVALEPAVAHEKLCTHHRVHVIIPLFHRLKAHVHTL